MGQDENSVRNSSLLCYMGFVVIVVLAVGCRSERSSQEDERIQITTIAAGRFLEVFEKELSDLSFLTKASSGAVANTDAVENGRADIAFAQADVVYRAFTNGTDLNPVPHTKLRGMAVLYNQPLHLIVGSSVDFQGVRDLRGKQIGVSSVATATQFTARLVLSAFGISRLNQVAPAEIPGRLANGSLDAVFDLASTAVIRGALAIPGTRLVSIEGAEITSLREEYPFLRPAIIPAETYGQSQDVRTFGVERIIVCHEDLPEDIVYRILSVFFDSIPELVVALPELRTIHLDRAAGTPIPLHPGAARFYREHQLR